MKESMQAANLAIIMKRWAGIGKVLSDAPLLLDVEIDKRLPCPPLVIDGIHLCSGYHPDREAEVHSSLVPADSRFACVYGVGGGTIMRLLLARSAIERVVVVIMNHQVAVLSFQYYDQSDWLSDPRVELVLAEDEGEVRWPFAVVPSCLQLASDAASRLRDLVFLELATPYIQQKIGADGFDAEDRFRQNDKFLKVDGDVAELFGTRQGETVFVAAAGPTLNSHFQRLQGRPASSVLIAVDAALKPLVDHGIVPDIVICIDRNDLVVTYFKGMDSQLLAEKVLVYSPVVHSEILNLWPGERLVTYTESDLYGKIQDKYPGTVLFSSGSVLHPAIDLAVQMGGARVVLLGADFSFPGGRSHAEGSPAELNRAAVAMEHWVLDGHGARVDTTPNFRGFVRDLERYIAQHAGVEFINGSRMGARIEGTTYLERWPDVG